MNFQPKDLIALITIIGGFVLMWLKVDHAVGGIMIMITTYYFRKREDEITHK